MSFLQTRRSFLQTFTSAAAGLVLDPERLLWVPGRTTIFIPPVLRRAKAIDVWLDDVRRKIFIDLMMTNDVFRETFKGLEPPYRLIYKG